MNLITATEIMRQIQLLSESPANSKNERAFCLRDIRDCAVRLLDGEAVPAVKESLTTENKEPTTPPCLELCRNGRLCGGATSYLAEITLLKATIKAIGEMEQVTTLRIRRLSECNPEFTKAKWVLASSPSTGDKYETLEALLNRRNNDG